MNERNENRMKTLLQHSLPPTGGATGPERDLWPAMLRRLELKPAAAAPASSVCAWDSAWFDGVLLAGLVALAAIFPSAIPVLLYYL